MNATTPYFDTHRVYEVSRFHHHELQKHFALFVSQPELYRDISAVSDAEKQEYMFSQFHLFLQKYYQFNYETQYDELAYFGSLSQDKAGFANICGGAGKASGSFRKEFLDKYRAGQKYKRVKIDYLSKKYRLTFGANSDPRLFLGHTEPWTRLTPELLKKEGWEWVSAQSYTDATFATPFPEIVDGDLVPLAIRNKVLQKWRAHRNALVEQKLKQNRALRADDEEEEDEGVVESKTPESSVACVVQLSAEDLQQFLDEDW